MRFSTAIEFIKNGYFVADDAMKKMGAAIGLINNISEIDNSIIVMKDDSGMEAFFLDPSMIFDDREWYVAIEDEDEYSYNYYKIDDSNRTINCDDAFDDAIESKECKCYYTSDCNCTESKDTKEDKRKRLLELQKEFLSKTTQLIYESDLTKKIKLYNDLADLTAEINELGKEAH